MRQKKWIKVNHLSSAQYSSNKKVRFKALMLRSNFCDYSDTYIVVKGEITAAGTNNAKKRNKRLSRIMLHLDHQYQNLITHSYTTQKYIQSWYCYTDV